MSPQLNNHLPCLEGPWSTLVAVDLDVGEFRWERPVGSTPWIDVGERASKWGYITNGGPMVTEGGVTAGGDLTSGEGRGDHVMAFRLASDTPSDVRESAGE